MEIIFKIPYKVNAKKLFIEDATKIVAHISKVLSEGKTNEQFEKNLRSIYSKKYKEEQALTRIQFAKLLDETVHPFEKMDVNHKGNFKQSSLNVKQRVLPLLSGLRGKLLLQKR